MKTYGYFKNLYGLICILACYIGEIFSIETLTSVLYAEELIFNWDMLWCYIQ